MHSTNHKRPLLVEFIGVTGVGKSTLVAAVCEALSCDGIRVGVAEDLLRRVQGDRLPVDGGVGQDADECALELADVFLDPVGDETADVVGDQAAVRPQLGVEDGQPGLEIRWLDVCHQAALEAAGYKA